MPGHTLVTGGCGFFGTSIIRRLLDDGEKVTVFDVAHYIKRWELLMSSEEIARITFIQGAVDEPALVNAITELKPDAVIHLAGLQIPTCRENPVLGARVNVIGTLNVFEAAKKLKAAGEKVPTIVYASSAAVFGPDEEYAGETAVSNSSVPKPESHYAAFKLCTEHCAKAYWGANGIASVGLRPLTVYGPGRDQGLTSFPSRSIAAAVKGQAFDIPFSGPTAYIHIREVADMFVTISRATGLTGSKVYTVGGDTADTAEFVRLLDVALPGAAKLITVSGGALPIASHLDDAELRRDYPTIIRLPLGDGIKETVQLYAQLEKEGRLVV